LPPSRAAQGWTAPQLELTTCTGYTTYGSPISMSR
jgi:hypothetical protein